MKIINGILEIIDVYTIYDNQHALLDIETNDIVVLERPRAYTIT